MRGLIVIVAACGGTKSAAPIMGSAPSTTVSAEEANRVLHDDAPLDYKRPLDGKPWNRSATTQLFHDNCKAGDKQACIVEAELVPRDARAAVYAIIGEHCRAGDRMSCRALPRHDSDDDKALRKDCDAGFPGACIELAANEPSDADAISRRAQELAKQGCAAGIALECGMVIGDIRSAQRLCDLQRVECEALGILYERQHDLIHAREERERACQYRGHDPWSCIGLGNDYLDHKLEEPIPGRGQALLDYGCREAATANHGTLSEANEPICKRAKLTSN